ncbi:MAG: protein-S-isoprenylcysteine O-methyltransferase [Pseudomonadota bacterium]
MKLLQGLMWLLFIVGIGAIVWRWETNGWGTLGWLATMVLIGIIRAPYARRNAENTVTEKRATVVERLLLLLITICAAWLPIIQLATGALSFANYPLPGWAVYVGFGLLVPGLFLFWRSHADLGRNWSVTTELREDHTLTTTGVYSRVRHPMYTAIWIMYAAQPLFIPNWIAGFGALASFALMYVIRVPYEEAMMREQFGEAYDAYCAKTGRLWPKL